MGSATDEAAAATVPDPPPEARRAITRVQRAGRAVVYGCALLTLAAAFYLRWGRGMGLGALVAFLPFAIGLVPLFRLRDRAVFRTTSDHATVREDFSDVYNPLCAPWLERGEDVTVEDGAATSAAFAITGPFGLGETSFRVEVEPGDDGAGVGILREGHSYLDGRVEWSSDDRGTVVRVDGLRGPTHGLGVASVLLAQYLAGVHVLTGYGYELVEGETAVEFASPFRRGDVA